MDLKEEHKNLTSVDIESQKDLWDERGKGYYGEYLVFCKLYKQLAGTCKILMNLQIPVAGNLNKTTEIDLLLIHETGLYVFEIKHYKGTIYGKVDDEKWTQYFRTTKNKTFGNPIIQNEYHISNLKNLVENVPIYSVVVFSNDDCKLKIKDKDETKMIYNINNMDDILQSKLINNEHILSMDDINQIFEKLTIFSSMKEKVFYENTEKEFYTWLEPIIKDLENAKNNFELEIKKKKKIKRNFILINIVTIIILIISTITIIEGIKINYNNNLFQFKQNFLHIDEINNEYITQLNELFLIEEKNLRQIASNIVSFTATIKTNNDIYGMMLTENSKYLVFTKSGQVYEYNVFGEHLKYNKYSNMLGNGINNRGKLAEIQFYGINVDDINYIKLTKINLFKLISIKTIIKSDLELELYKNY